MSLSSEQRQAAEALLKLRPPVIAGTRAIIDREKAENWHRAVSQTMARYGVKRENVTEFCDVAGVAD